MNFIIGMSSIAFYIRSILLLFLLSVTSGLTDELELQSFDSSYLEMNSQDLSDVSLETHVSHCDDVFDDTCLGPFQEADPCKPAVVQGRFSRDNPDLCYHFIFSAIELYRQLQPVTEERLAELLELEKDHALCEKIIAFKYVHPLKDLASKLKIPESTGVVDEHLGRIFQREVINALPIGILEYMETLISAYKAKTGQNLLIQAFHSESLLKLLSILKEHGEPRDKKDILSLVLEVQKDNVRRDLATKGDTGLSITTFTNLYRFAQQVLSYVFSSNV